LNGAEIEHRTLTDNVRWNVRQGVGAEIEHRTLTDNVRHETGLTSRISNNTNVATLSENVDKEPPGCKAIKPREAL
jgi:hypothetical protein